MDPRTKDEIASLMREILAWLTGARGRPSSPDIPLISNPEDLKIAHRIDEISGEELLEKARALKAQTFIEIKRFSERLATATPAEGSEISRYVNNLISFSSALNDKLRRLPLTLRLDDDPSRFKFRKGENQLSALHGRDIAPRVRLVSLRESCSI